MKNSLAIFALVFPLTLSAAEISPALRGVQNGVSRPAPAELEYNSYLQWAGPMLREGGRDRLSAFTSRVFDWYRANRDTGLPPEVYKNPEKIYVNIDRPLAETIELEASGEIEEGNTVGAEVYAEQSGSVKEALETMLYRWGKPTGAVEGKTYPPGGQFARRVEYYAPNPDWGPNAFANLSVRKDGGIVQNLTDRYLLLIRGDEAKGYDVLMQYLQPGGSTATQQVFAISLIRPVSPGKVAYKISTRFQGQSYKILGGVKIGRTQVGFNVQKIRAVQVESNGFLRELQTLGAIPDRKTDIEFVEEK